MIKETQSGGTEPLVSAGADGAGREEGGGRREEGKERKHCRAGGVQHRQPGDAGQHAKESLHKHRVDK